MNKKLFILVLMVLIGIGLISFNSSIAKADEARTIKMKSKGVAAVPTVISSQGADVFMITGFASSSNCNYSVHDVASLAGDVATTSNVKAEGGEATQYDSVPNVDFGPEGLRFDTGVVVHTTTCTLSVLYR